MNLNRPEKGFLIDENKFFAKTYKIEAPVLIESGVHGHISIGAFSYTRATTIRNCKIGRYCSIANGCFIGVAQHPMHTVLTTAAIYQDMWDSLFQRKGNRIAWDELPPIQIANDVWIGQNVIIMPGVKIGNGAVIGAGAVVTKNVPDYAIMGGVSAKLLRYRFHDQIIEKLLKIQPWKYNIYDFQNINLNNIEETLEMLENKIIKNEIKPYKAKTIRKQFVND